MLAEPLSNLMLLILLFFLGLMLMFIYMARALGASARKLDDIRRQLGLALADLDQRMENLTFELKNSKYPDEAKESALQEPDLSDLLACLPGGEPFGAVKGEEPEPEGKS
ncbi:MAG: hypothetical protein LBQ63_05285 [Deltaproteobacteria bacterium]|nr:hypothetical protein [Deltaproteobacteria bacterium]